jgi:hypothetical protein
MAAWFLVMLRNFYFVTHRKIGNNSEMTEARDKNIHKFRILGILEFFDARLTKFKAIEFYLIKLGTDL